MAVVGEIEPEGPGGRERLLSVDPAAGNNLSARPLLALSGHCAIGADLGEASSKPGSAQSVNFDAFIAFCSSQPGKIEAEILAQIERVFRGRIKKRGARQDGLVSEFLRR